MKLNTTLIRSGPSAASVTIYGIKNCDTVKRARSWLDGQDVAYRFHDYKTVGIDRNRLEGWCRQLGWELVLNRAGTTFRRLPDAEKEALHAPKAITLMLAYPSLIKRPVLDYGSGLLLGFNPDSYAEALRAVREPGSSGR